MKKLICLCAVLFLLGGCATSVVPGAIPAESPGVGDTTATDSPTAIPGVKDLTAGDVSAVAFWYEGAADDSMITVDQQTIEPLLDGLKLVRLTGRPDEEVKLAPTLKYDIALNSGVTLHIAFAGLYVVFGDGAYTYEYSGSTGFPPDVRHVSVGAGDMIGAYEDASDVTSLLALAAASPGGEGTYSEEAAALTLTVISASQPAEEYRIQKTDAGVYVYRRFFTLNICFGTISDEAYAQLVRATNSQFGTLLQLSVTSGGATIYPAPHFACATTYDAASGQMLAADGFPRLEDYLDTLETLTLTSDFTVWTKDPGNTAYKLLRDGETVREGDVLTASAFDGLTPGTYQAEIYRTVAGAYIESLGMAESATDVFYFQVTIDEGP